MHALREDGVALGVWDKGAAREEDVTKGLCGPARETARGREEV